MQAGTQYERRQKMNIEMRRARNRQMFIFLLVCTAIFGLLGRLYYWQVLQSDRLSRRASYQHTQSETLNAPRGLIYDAQGRILATNVIRDDVYIEPIQFLSDYPDTDQYQAKLQKVIQQLHQVLPNLSEEKLHAAFNLQQRNVRIAGAITPAQSQQLQEMQLPYTFLEPRTWRTYPSAELAAQVLGYVQDGVGGVYGIEKTYDKQLTGQSGTFMAETDLNGNPLIVGASADKPAVPGANLTLTIDSTMQYIVQTALAERVKALKSQGGTVVVVNARTGAIVAMAGEPTFDPNHYGDYYNERGCLGTQSVYFNPALNCGYEPGSVMKSVTMAAALDQGLITPDQTINDPGYVKFPDAVRVTNWDYRPYGQETMTGVLEHSANVGAAIVAHDILKADRFYPYLQRFGFGQPTHLSYPEATYQYRVPGSPGWTPSDLTRQSFGQAIWATPLQVAMAYQAIANGGVMMHPYLVSSIDNNGKVTQMNPQVERQVINAKAAKTLTGMLVSAADYNQQATFPGYSIAVKTGTATTQGIADDQTEASMAGFLPASNPQFVILVKLDRPQGQNSIFGGTAAAPLWKYIGQQLMLHYQILPDRTRT
jgi:cell division protein FtsI/penicillin-binding protein 2